MRINDKGFWENPTKEGHAHDSRLAGAIPAGKLVTLKVDAVKTIKVGQGTSVQIDFTLAPKEKWFTAEEQESAPAAAPAQDDDEF